MATATTATLKPDQIFSARYEPRDGSTHYTLLVSRERLHSDFDVALEWAWGTDGWAKVRPQLEAQGRRPVTVCERREPNGWVRSCFNCRFTNHMADGRCRRDGLTSAIGLVCPNWESRIRSGARA